jgi:hypothetical protein
MSGLASLALETPAPAAGRGRFVPSFRNRPIGEERVEWGPTSSGGIGLRAETAIAVGHTGLSQTVVAEFDAVGRPERCRISARRDSRESRIDVEVAGSRVQVQVAGDLECGSRVQDLPHEPLLLVDNCFSLHALSALLAFRAATSCGRFSSIPALQDLDVIAPGQAPVLLGGERFEPPTVTLRLTDALSEHVWICRGRVQRLIIPEIQIRVDWRPDPRDEGGGR